MSSMIDLHCHILPGIDDGAHDLAVSLAMARQYVADGVGLVACTPHILPGLYPNSGTTIRAAVDDFRSALRGAGIPLEVIAGADNHMVPDFVAGLQQGHLLSLGDTRYVLVEPPHHVLPARMEHLLFSLKIARFVPILTHPERLTWIRDHYALILRLADNGVWMQVTAGSLAGRFGRDATYWAERLLDDGAVHILATDAHDHERRPPDLARGRDLAARRVGEAEALRLVSTRPAAILRNSEPHDVAPPVRGAAHGPDEREPSSSRPHTLSGRLGRRLRGLFSR